MKIEEIRELPKDEIETRVRELRKKVFDLKVQAGGEDIENPGSAKQMRREIARMLTVMRERELAREAAKKEEGGGSA